MCLARQLREAAGGDEAAQLQFVPAVMDAVPPSPTLGQGRSAPRCKTNANVGIIEIEVEGVTIRAGRGADARMIATIVQALKATL
jgi:transposase